MGNCVEVFQLSGLAVDSFFIFWGNQAWFGFGV